MKFRKILAAVTASVVAVCATAVTASAADSYTATLGFADGSWTAQDWVSACEVTGDGTYSITANCFFTNVNADTGEETYVAAPGTGVTVFVIDIARLCADVGADKVKVTDIKVTTGDKELAIDQSKVLSGDLEGNGNLRIEIYNSYGRTAVNQQYNSSVSPIDPSSFSFTAANQFTVSFTLSGIDGTAEETTASTEAPAETTTATTTTAVETTTTTTTTEATTTTTTTTTTEETTTPAPETETEESSETEAEETEAAATTTTTKATTTTTAEVTTSEETTTTTAAPAATAPVEQAVSSSSDNFASRNSQLMIFAIVAIVVIVAAIVGFVIIAIKKKK